MTYLKLNRPPEKTRRKLRAHGALRCPFNGHQVSWCRHLCEPIGGRGLCGRLATHRMRSRTQKAIARHLAKQQERTEESAS